jgi:penicillin-binding protein
MGFTSLLGSDNTNTSMAIGALTRGVTVEEDTNAYTTFGNGGKFVDAYMIDRIVTTDGKVIYKHKVKPVKVFSRQTNYLMLDMMRSVLSNGTGTTARRDLNFQADWAGKTGTSQNIKDSWFIATNPNVTLGVWIGFANGDPLIASSHSQRNQQIWASLANAAYKVDPKLMDPDERFHMPTGIVRRSVCEISGMLPSKQCSEAGLVTSDLFNQKYAPNQTGDALIGGGPYFSIKPGFIESHFLGVTSSEFYANLPADWKNIVPPDKLRTKEKQAKQKEKKKQQQTEKKRKNRNQKENHKKNSTERIGNAAKTTNDQKAGDPSEKNKF